MNSKWNFAVVVSLFFLWALAHNLNPILISQLKQAFSLNDVNASLVDASFYLAYFIGAIPAGIWIRKRGYKSGVLLGLVLFAAGAFGFFPAAQWLSYPIFLVSLFTIGFGLTFLETSANPLVTQFEVGKGPSFRLNLAQSFNGLGATLAGWIGGFLVFKTTDDVSTHAELAQSVVTPYLLIGSFVLLVALFFSRVNISETGRTLKSGKPLANVGFRWAMMAQFLYVGAQVGVCGFFIRYVVQYYHWSKEDAAYLFSLALLCFMIGRFLGTFLLRWISGRQMLFFCSSTAMLISVYLSLQGWGSIYLFLLLLLMMSIMFPTIFSLGMEVLNSEDQPMGASLIIMTIVGGALIPPAMGKISDLFGLSWAYLLPAICFLFILIFAKKTSHGIQ
jgi:FHS family L-fucose permease-like MFS transporter